MKKLIFIYVWLVASVASAQTDSAGARPIRVAKGRVVITRSSWEMVNQVYTFVSKEVCRSEMDIPVYDIRNGKFSRQPAYFSCEAPYAGRVVHPGILAWLDLVPADQDDWSAAKDTFLKHPGIMLLFSGSDYLHDGKDLLQSAVVNNDVAVGLDTVQFAAVLGREIQSLPICNNAKPINCTASGPAAVFRASVSISDP